MPGDALDALVRALDAISPMPDDDALEAASERLAQYVELADAIGRELDGQFDARAVRALARSFGPGDGFEAYWATVHLIERFHRLDETYALLREVAAEGLPGPGKWCTLLLRRRYGEGHDAGRSREC